jgi:putative ABC transport system permease protein
MGIERWYYRIRTALRGVFSRDLVEDELAAELRDHVEREAEHQKAYGVSHAEAARRAGASLRAVEAVKERCREIRPTRWVEDLVKDSRVAMRSFGRNPLFAIICVSTLGLGIAANTTIFSAMDTLLVRPLPYRDADRVVFTLGWNVRTDSMLFNVRPADWVEWRDTTRSFEAVSAYRYLPANLTGVDRPARLRAYRITPNSFSLLGVDPLLGRDFRDSDAAPGADAVAVLSHAVWQSRFGGDSTVVGRDLILNDAAVTVVGVMPPRFAFPQSNWAGDLWLPLGFDVASLASNRESPASMVSVARLKPTVSLEQAQAEMDTIYQRLEAANPATNAGIGVRIRTMQQMLADVLFAPLVLLMAVVAVVLLIICANVASLLLARASARAREMAIRDALGAGRLRLFRQLLTEALILAGLGGGLGVLLSVWGLGALRPVIPDDIASVMPAVREMGVDLRVLAFSGGVSLLATLAFGLAPALMLSNPAADGRLANRSSGDGGRRRHRLLSLLVVGEVALSAMLLVGAGLTTRSLWNVLQVDPGFDSRGLLVLDLTMPAARYPDATRRGTFLTQLVDRLRTLPGVETAGVVNSLPMSQSNSSTSVIVAGQAPPAPGDTPRSDYRVVSQGYFDTMGMSLLRGRGFETRDRDTTTPVVVVNQAFADRLLAGDEAVGQRIKLGLAEGASWQEIVGVVGDVKHTDLTRQANPEAYVPLRQLARASMTLVVRASGPTSGLEAAIETELHALDPDQPADGVYPMEQAVGNSPAMLLQRGSATFTVAFGVLALLLATMGLYGVIAYVAAQQVPELAIRMALGAQPRDVLRMVLRKGAVLALVGIGLGLAAAFAITRLLASLLYGLTASDPVTFSVVAVGLVAVTLLACYLPARRASRIDPMTALRLE